MRGRIVVLAAALAFSSAAFARLDREIVGAEQDHSLSAGTSVSCADSFNNAFTLQPQQLREQSQHEFDLGPAPLDVSVGNLGGVVVRGWQQAHTRLVVCRFAAADTTAAAAKLLEDVNVSYEKGVVRATGPAISERQVWWVNLTLFVPQRTPVTVRAQQGGIAVRNMRSKIEATSVSGGISIARSSGRHLIRTDSGGITIDRVTGPVDARSRDGSIAIKLPSYEAPSIEANTAATGQILCVIDRCNDPLEALRRTSLRLGDSTPRVRLSTGTGSIHISSVKS
jgi:hypothetical protein